MKRSGSALRVPLFAVSLMVLAGACAHHGNWPPATAVPAAVPSTERLKDAYGRLPLHFEENRGQAGVGVRYVARTSAGSVLLTAGGFSLPADGGPVRLAFAGGAPAPSLQALEPLAGRVNYYRGNGPNNWHTDVPTTARVRYAAVYPGIDVVVYGNQRQLEYDFVVASGADAGAIRVTIYDADAVELDAAGNVNIRRGGRTIVQRAPVVYQERDGRRELVPARYVVRNGRDVTFDISAYDRSRPLIIDPVVVYAARIGLGTALSIAVDNAGYAYFAGGNTGAFNNEYPMVNAAFPQRVTGLDEIFVTKLSPDGASLVYSTYIGSASRDFLHGIATDGAGNAYITGATHSGYPTTPDAFQPTTVGGAEDGSVSFVTKFGPTGALVYSTFLDGTTFDNPADPIRGGVCYQGQGRGIAADAGGHAYVVGYTSTNNFPTTPGAYIPTKPTTGRRCLDFPAGYLTKLLPDGSSLVYSTYLDGNGVGRSVAIDNAGNAYVGGTASPPSAPPGTLTASLAPGGATTGNYVAKFNATGLPSQTTVIGPSPDSISVGSDGSAYVASGAASGSGFAGRLNPGGTAWLWTTALPGVLTSIAAAPDLSAWVAGYTDADSFPTKDPLRAKTAQVEAVVLKLSSAGSLLFSTTLGDGRAFGVAVDNAGDAYVTGGAGADFISTTPGAYSSPPSASEDVFVLKLSDAATPPSADTKPTVSILKPSDTAWTGNSIDIAAMATDDKGLQHIELWGDGAVFGTIPCSGTTCSGTILWITGPLPPAAYEVNAVATDSAGNQTVSPKITLFKDATSPVRPSGATPLTATITTPANGATVSGNVTVSMAAGSVSGSPLFELKVDNSSVLFSGAPGTTTVSTPWSTQAYANGAHTLGLRVTDGARIATAGVTVTVSNSTGGGGAGNDTVGLASPRFRVRGLFAAGPSCGLPVRCRPRPTR